MLILTRRVGETLMIGDDVQVSVLGVKGNQVRIGVEAPKDVGVHRQEIYNRIQSNGGVRITRKNTSDYDPESDGMRDDYSDQDQDQDPDDYDPRYD